MRRERFLNLNRMRQGLVQAFKKFIREFPAGLEFPYRDQLRKTTAM